jgi:hypothetical protein
VQEILAGWLLRDVARSRLEPALRKLQQGHEPATPLDGPGVGNDERNVVPIDGAVVDGLLRWARLDARVPYVVKSIR